MYDFDPEFSPCDTPYFGTPKDLLQHLYNKHEDSLYHALTIWVIENFYSSIIANIKLDKNSETKKQNFSEIHKGKVRLPSLAKSFLTFESSHLTR